MIIVVNCRPKVSHFHFKDNDKPAVITSFSCICSGSYRFGKKQHLTQTAVVEEHLSEAISTLSTSLLQNRFMDLRLHCGFLYTNYGKYIIDIGFKHPGGEINFIHIFNKIECQINIFPPFQNVLSQSIHISIILFRLQIKPTQGIITELPLAPNISN